MFTDEQASTLQKQSRLHGFDIFHAFHTSWYNDLIEKEGHVQSGRLKKLPCLPTSTTNTGANNAFLIGNTKYIWPFFIHWLSNKYEKGQNESDNIDQDIDWEDGILNNNPFDNYCREMFKTILQEYRDGNNYVGNDKNISFDIFLSDGKRYINEVIDDEGEDFLVSMQRIATLTGSYWLDNAGSRLCVHPQYGTWHSFRAVIVVSSKSSLPMEIKKPALPPPLPCPITKHEIDDAKLLMEFAIERSSSKGSAINMEDLKLSDHTRKCLVENNELSKVTLQVRPSALTWINVRDCISLGRDNYRYDKEQLCYHYTRDSEILRKIILKP